MCEALVVKAKNDNMKTINILTSIVRRTFLAKVIPKRNIFLLMVRGQSKLQINLAQLNCN